MISRAEKVQRLDRFKIGVDADCGLQKRRFTPCRKVLMARARHGLAIGVICRPDGALLEVSDDKLVLASDLLRGLPFTSIVDPSSVPKAIRYLREIQENDSSAVCELEIALPQGTCSLFFSGFRTTRGTVLVGCHKPLPAKSMFYCMAKLARRSPDSLRDALEEILIRERGRARPKQALDSPEVSFLTALAHDLRNPIAGTLAASQYLLEDAAGSLEEEHTDLLRSIESSSCMALQLIDDLLEMSTAQSGDLQLNLQPADILSLIDQNLRVSRLLGARKGTRLDVMTDGPVPAIRADLPRMNRVIGDLLRNAIEISPPVSRIEIRVGTQGECARISVRDEGPGGSADELEATFDPFHRPQTHRRSTELGLRLAIMKRTVEAHGGQVLVESKVGQGSTFTILLPISVQPAARQTDTDSARLEESRRQPAQKRAPTDPRSNFFHRSSGLKHLQL
jgi:signal transduction histidine kinase